MAAYRMEHRESPGCPVREFRGNQSPHGMKVASSTKFGGVGNDLPAVEGSHKFVSTRAANFF